MAVTVADILASDDPLTLAPDWDGGCPCVEIQGEGFTVRTHCWRVGRCCAYSGTHVTGTLDDATRQRIADHVAKHVWYESTAKITRMKGDPRDA